MVYAIAKRVPYGTHVIVLFLFAFSAFVLVYAPLLPFDSPSCFVLVSFRQSTV